MKFKLIATTTIVLAMAVGRADPVQADADGLVGGIVGGIIGGVIVNEANKSKRRTTSSYTRTTRSSGISSAQREANREVQVALNQFGFPVGTPDGALGPRSRGAISQYQALLGYPPTGQLTEYERTVLLTSYQRVIAGGPVVAQTVSTHPLGMRGFLLVQRDEMAGIVPAQPAPTGGVLATAAPAAPQATAPVLPSLVAEEPANAPTALPSFMADSTTQVSLASQCNKISLVTNTNGGYTTAAAMTDPMFALSEQFCLARTYAMATGEELAAKSAGFTPAQITEQCQAFGPVLKDQVAAVSLQPRDQVLQGVQSFVLQSGMSPAQLSGTAKVCLGVGYTTDNMNIAIGSALLLTALGEGAYGELLGHHLSQGYGATVRPDLALDWYDTGLAAMGSGAAIFAPGIADRPELIRKAAFTIGGRADAALPPALPQFAADPAAATQPEMIAAPVLDVVAP